MSQIEKNPKVYVFWLTILHLNELPETKFLGAYTNYIDAWHRLLGFVSDYEVHKSFKSLIFSSGHCKFSLHDLDNNEIIFDLNITPTYVI